MLKSVYFDNVKHCNPLKLVKQVKMSESRVCRKCMCPLYVCFILNKLKLHGVY